MSHVPPLHLTHFTQKWQQPQPKLGGRNCPCSGKIPWKHGLLGFLVFHVICSDTFFPPKFIIYLTYIYVSVLVFLKDRCQRGTRQISSGKLLSWPHGPGFLALAKPNPLHCTPSKETNFHPLRIIEPGSFTPADELPHDCPRSQMCISQQQSPGILAKI